MGKRTMTDEPKRWTVRQLTYGERPSFFVRDSRLGYCTVPMPRRMAEREARRLNREQP